MATILNLSKIRDDTATKTSGIVKKSGSKKLYVDFRYNGVRIVKSTGLDDTPENFKKVYEWLTRQKEKISKGTFVFAKAFPGAPSKEKAFHAKFEKWEYKPEAQNVLFQDYVNEWKLRFLDRCQSKTKERDFSQVIEYWLIPYFGKMSFYQISGVTIKEFIQKLIWKDGKNKGQPLSASRIQNIMIPLRTIWNDACEEYRWQLANPFTYAKRQIPKRLKKHPEVFRFDDWKAIINSIDPFFMTIAETMIMTGMIGSEIAGLRKKDIQSDHIVIRNSIVRNHEKANLKNEYRQRKLPLTKALRMHIETAMNRSKSDYVFSMKSGRRFDVDSFRKNPWTTALKKAGVTYQVPYVMRHSFAAWSLTLRVDPNRLVSLMGHSSKKMIYEVYGNYVEGLEKDAGKILKYYGNDFIELNGNSYSPFAYTYGESPGESQGVI